MSGLPDHGAEGGAVEGTGLFKRQQIAPLAQTGLVRRFTSPRRLHAEGRFGRSALAVRQVYTDDPSVGSCKRIVNALAMQCRTGDLKGRPHWPALHRTCRASQPRR